jgi:GAF domain-containing protein
MIERIRQRLRYNYVNPVDRQRAIGLTVMNTTIIVGWLLGILSIVIPAAVSNIALDSYTSLIFIITPILVVVTQRAVMNSNLQPAVWIFLAFLFVITFLVRLSGLNTPIVITLVLPVVAAGVLLSRRALLFASAVLGISILISAFYQSQNFDAVSYVPADNAFLDLTTIVISLGIALIFLYIFSGQNEQLASESLQNFQRLDMMAEFEQQLSMAHDENTVMLRLNELIVDRMVYTANFIHLLDAQGQLNRYVRTGMGTRHAVSRSNIGEENALRDAMNRQRMILITLDDDPVRRNHLLPSSHFGVAIPLIYNERVIGVLDVQSNQTTSPFIEAEQMALKLIANEFTTALLRVRETSNLHLAMQERESVNRRLQSQLADLRRGAEQSVGTDWASYIQGRGTDAFGFNLQNENTTLIAATDLPDELRPALQSGDTVVQETKSGQIINVPIMFRNEILGAMAFTLPPGRSISDRQLEMARTVSNRLALALENARLVEQSQAQALRERKASEVANLLIGQQEVSMLINVAAQNFNEALGAIYTRIYLEPEALASQVGE